MGFLHFTGENFSEDEDSYTGLELFRKVNFYALFVFAWITFNPEKPTGNPWFEDDII
jgi:hypothetical protein